MYSLWIGIILILHLIKNGEAFGPIPPGTVYSWSTPPPWGDSRGFCSEYEINKYTGAMPEELCTIFRKWEKGGAYRTEVEQRYGKIEYWDTSNVVSMSGIFSDSTINFDISQWDTSKVTNMQYMFYSADFMDASSQYLSDWDTSKVTTMKKMFENSDFNGDISDWDVSQVTDMQYMFYSSGDFYQDLSKWDMTDTNIYYMFYGADLMEENQVTLCDGVFGTKMSQALPWGHSGQYPRSGCCPAGTYMFNPQATLSNAFDPNSGCMPCPQNTVPTTKENAFLSCEERVHFIIGDQSKVTSDIPDGLYGDISGVTGDIPTTVYGNISGIIGDLSGVSGDLSGVSGNLSEVSGSFSRGSTFHFEGYCGDCVDKNDADALKEAYEELNECDYHSGEIG